MSRLPLVVVLLLVGSLFAGGLVAAQGSGYDLTVSSHTPVDTPDRTFEEPPREYTLDGIAVVERGDTIEVEVTVDDDEFSRLELLDASESWIDEDSGEGDRTASFETADRDFGSYMLALDVDGIHEAVFPVVINAHELDISHETDLYQDDELDVTVDVDAIDTDAPDPEGVEVVLWNDENTERFEIDEMSGGDWEGSLELSDVTTGDYDLYVATTGEETARGESEILGLSESDSVTVESDESNGDDGDSDDGSNGGGGDDTSDDGNGDDGANGDDTNGDDNGADDENGVDDTNGDDNGAGDNGTGDDANGDDNGADDGNGDDGTNGDGPPANGDEDDGDGVQMPTDDDDGVTDDGADGDGTDDSDDDTLIVWAPILILSAILGAGFLYRGMTGLNELIR